MITFLAILLAACVGAVVAIAVTEVWWRHSQYRLVQRETVKVWEAHGVDLTNYKRKNRIK